jgi:transglutaminase-like putative cysteine protease
MYFFSNRKPLAMLSLFCLTLIFTPVISAQDKKWRPVSNEEIQMKSPVIEADADAEALLWEVYVTDEESYGSMQTVLNHYTRIKIFNERGREAFSKVDIQYGRIPGIGLDIRIKDIAARTIKPDGSTVELKEADVFERDIVKGDGVKLKAKSFAMPGIEPGAIIEYRWKEIRGAVSFYQRLQFAREIPVHLVKYYIKPLPHPEYGMSGQPFNATNTPFVREKTGYYSTTMSNIPAFKDEPRMPPEYSIRPWLLLYYTKDGKIEPEKYWKDYGRKQYEDHKALMKVTDEVRRAANEAVGSETNPEKKVEKIFNYVRAKIKNVLDDTLNLSAEDLKKLKDNKNPSDTLKRGQGDGHDINMLFAAMTTAAGLETRVANLPRRSDIFFPKWFTDDYFMRTENIAVKVGENWKFYDPLSRYIPFGMLRWEEEGQPVLISDSKEPIWATTQMSDAVKSLEKRSGKFKLLEDGTLEGVARIEFTGHLAAYHKEYNDEDTPQQREETLKNLVRYNHLSGAAEISDITIENVLDPDKPFTYIFKVRVPGYASRTGKRLFLQPGIFERNAKPLFETNNRRYNVYFQYPYAEKDDLTIELPAGFELENPDAPGVIKDNSGIGVLEVKMAVTTDLKFLTYKRDFSFGNGGNLVFPTKSYSALKGLFEAFNKGNSHAVTLRQTTNATSVK